MTEVSGEMAEPSGVQDHSFLDISLLKNNVIFNNAILPFAILKSDLTYLIANQAFASAVDLTSENISGKNHFDLFPQLDHEQQFKTAFTSGNPFIYSASNRDGPPLSDSSEYWDISLCPIPSGEGPVVHASIHLTHATDRVTSMQKVIEQKERLERASKSTALGVWEWNLQTDEIYWSDTQFKLYGYEPGEMTPTASNFEKSVLPIDLPLIKQAIRDARSGRDIDVSFRVIQPAGEVRYFTSRAGVTVDEDNKPLKVIGTTRDITDQKEYEARSHAFEAILNTNQDQLALIDRNYHYEVVNDAYCSIHGLKREDILGKHIAEIWGQDAFDDILKARLDRAFSGETVQISAWTDIKGVWKYMDAYFYPFSQNNRTPSHVILVARDATPMREAMDALQASESKFGGILDLAMEGIISINEKEEITLFNRGAEDMFGYKVEEAMGQHLSMLLPSRFHQVHTAHLGQFHRQLDTQKWMSTPREVRARRKSGEEFNIEASISKLELGEKTIMTVVMRDITEKLLADHALAESERQLKSFHENVQEGVFRTTTDGHWLYANPALLEILGYDSQEELMQVKVEDLYPASDGRDLWVARMQRGISTKNHEHQLMKKNGEKVWVRENSRIVRDDSGVDMWYEGTVTDITDSKLAEEHLASERERLALTLRSLTEGVITTDSSGLITLTNPAAEELLGKTFADMQNRPLTDIVHISREATGRPIVLPIDKLLAGDLHALAPQKGMLDRLSGVPVPVACSFSRLEYQEGLSQGLVMVIQDISEKQQLESEMLRSQKLESLGVLAGGLAHDFNNFLMSIMLNVSTASLFARENPKVLELLGDAEESIKRAKGITQQLMAFTRGGEPIKAEMRVGPLIREAAKFCVRGTNAKIEFQLAQDLRPAAIDPGQINQVINNLVINAVQAMPDGGLMTVVANNRSITERQPVGQLPLGDYLEISVSDRGEGILNEHLQRIFDPYYTTREQGTGLGLFSVFNIIDKHGGWITVDSTQAVGSTFTLYLPALEHGSGQTDAESAEVIPGSGRILIMDDDELVLKSLTGLLARIGYEVISASTGQEAVQLFENSLASKAPFRALIFDLTVSGGMGGEAAIAAIRKKGSQTPAIAMSGYTNTLTMLEPSSAQFQERLPKPFTLANLSQTLHRVLKSPDAPTD